MINAKTFLRGLTVLALAAVPPSCNGLLDVKQPGLITPEKVGSPSMQTALVVAAAGAYHQAFNWMANSGASESDEAIFSHTWTPWEEYDNRNVTPAGGAWDGIGYQYMQSAKTTAARVVDLLATAGQPAQKAEALMWDGFSAILLADYMCSIPLNGKAAVTRDVAYDTAIGLLKASVGVSGAPDTLVMLDNLGLARAYLNKGDFQNAYAYASKVPPTFAGYINFIDADFGEWATKYNLYARTSGLKDASEFNLALDPSGEWGQGKRDLRVPFESDSTRQMFSGAAGGRQGYLPFTPSSFQNYTPGNHRRIQGGDGIRFASGLEAQYIIAEASLKGAGTLDVLAFINGRRAAGGLPAYAGATTNDALFAELREQRKMDLYFAGYRVPDLLRYEHVYKMDPNTLWPTGRMGGYAPSAAFTYGTTTCLPIAQSEIANNPNIGH